MAELRTAMDSAFWDLNVSTPQTLDGIARSIPGEPLPMDATRASRALRIQQMSLVKRGFPKGLIPSYSPRENGSFAFQSLLLNPTFSNWWLGLVGQIRPMKLISALKADVQGVKKWDFPVFKRIAKRLVDTSPYSVGLTTQLSLSDSSSLLLSTEKDYDGEERRNKAMLYHQVVVVGPGLEEGRDRWPLNQVKRITFLQLPSVELHSVPIYSARLATLTNTANSGKNTMTSHASMHV